MTLSETKLSGKGAQHNRTFSFFGQSFFFFSHFSFPFSNKGLKKNDTQMTNRNDKAAFSSINVQNAPHY